MLKDFLYCQERSIVQHAIAELKKRPENWCVGLLTKKEDGADYESIIGHTEPISRAQYFTGGYDDKYYSAAELTEMFTLA